MLDLEMINRYDSLDGADTGIRAKARKIIDDALPPNKIITSDGPTADQFKRMTGVSQDTLEKNWAKGGHLTCCNGFTGWFGAQLGSKQYMGVFDLKHLAEINGTKDAWVVSTASNRPKYGDILRHVSFHVDVCLDFSGDLLLRAAGGQGGPIAHHDVIRRVDGKLAYDWKKLIGWIDIESYFV